MRQAQAQRGIGPVDADRNTAGAVTVERLLPGKPLVEVRVPGGTGAAGVAPPVEMPLAQPRPEVPGVTVRAHPAIYVSGPHCLLKPAGGGQERGTPDAVGAGLPPLVTVRVTQIPGARAHPLAAADSAPPPVDRMVTGDPDHLGPVDRVKRRSADQCRQELQPVMHHPAVPAPAQRQR